MNRFRGVVMMAIALLTGCASTPNGDDNAATINTARIVAAKPIVFLNTDQLAEYWLLGDALIGGDKPRYKKTIDYGCVRVGFGIDSEGRLFDARVLKSNPQARYSEQALKRVNELEPEATEMNSAKQPVRSEVILTFANADGEIQLVKYDAIARLCQ